MENIMDFIKAAMPWIAIGVLLAIFSARNAGKKKNEEHTDNYGTEGMCIGMCFGTAIGTSLGNNTGIGISLGMLIGMVIDSAIQKKEKDDTDN